MFRWLRRRVSPPPSIPDALWERTLAAYPFLARRPDGERERLRELAARFLQDKEFHGTQGLVITDDIALAIAAQAVLPVLHLGLGWYDDFVGIVVHPGEVVAHRTAMDDAGVVHHYDEVLAGEAMDRGPVMLSWSDVQAGASLSHEGYNVVIHEFAHKLDLRDGVADGCPPLPSAEAGMRWHAAFKPAYERFREQLILADRFGGEEPWLDRYAATDAAEFFAVTCEAYFVQPERLAADFPMVAEMLDRFFSRGFG